MSATLKGAASAPEPLVQHKPARIEPADQDAGEVGEPVPAQRERAELNGDRIDFGKGDGEHGPGGRGPADHRRPVKPGQPGRLAPTRLRHISIATICALQTRGFRRVSADRGRMPGGESKMTQTSNRLLDEFAKLMTDAAGVAQGMRREVETAIKSQAERFLGEMDVVQREEFDAVRDMAARAREENEALRRRIDDLESRLGADGAAPGRRAARARRKRSERPPVSPWKKQASPAPRLSQPTRLSIVGAKEIRICPEKVTRRRSSSVETCGPAAKAARRRGRTPFACPLFDARRAA